MELNAEPAGLAEPAGQEAGWSVETPGWSTTGDHNLLRRNECAEFFTGFRNLVRDDSGYRRSAGSGCASCGIFWPWKRERSLSDRVGIFDRLRSEKPQPGSRQFRLPQGGEQRLRALAIFSTSRLEKTAF